MATKDEPSTLPGFVAPGTATDYDVVVTSALDAGANAEVTVVARGDVTFEAGASIEGRQVNVIALGKQGDTTTGNVTDRVTTPTGAGAFAIGAIELAVIVANDQVGSASSAEGGSLNVLAPSFDLLKGASEDALVDPGTGGIFDDSAGQADAIATVYGTALGGSGLFSTPNFSSSFVSPTNTLGLETTGLGEFGVIDEGLFLLPDPYAAPEPAILVPPLQDPDFPADLRPDDPDDDVAWSEFYDDVLREYVGVRYRLSEQGSEETRQRSEQAVTDELAGLIAYYEAVRTRERAALAAQDEELEELLEQQNADGEEQPPPDAERSALPGDRGLSSEAVLGARVGPDPAGHGA
jgi:hypothetical protein